MLLHLLICGAVLMGAGVGISLGALLEHRRVTIVTIHWISRIIALIGCLMGYYTIKTLGL